MSPTPSVVQVRAPGREKVIETFVVRTGRNMPAPRRSRDRTSPRPVVSTARAGSTAGSAGWDTRSESIVRGLSQVRVMVGWSSRGVASHDVVGSPSYAIRGETNGSLAYQELPVPV